MSKLKTLEQHNKDRMAMYERMQQKRYNGIACPRCEKELYDADSHGMQVTLASNPPQKHTRCDCGYTGYRLA